MARRPLGYGMTAEIKRKMDSKYNPDDAKNVGSWIDAVLGRAVVGDKISQSEFQAVLKDGIALCQVMNILIPGSIKKINESKMAFKMMENISRFLEKATQYGMKSTDLFQTVDLYEGQNMVQVVISLTNLASVARTKGVDVGVDVGVKMSQENKRAFTEEQIKEGQNIISLQMGTNKGASQQGMTGYGATRQIINK